MQIQLAHNQSAGRFNNRQSILAPSPEERKAVEQLKARDAEVRAHEQAHKGAGGQYVSGGITYRYQTGPDGKQYAVAGEVSIDTSKAPGNPEATIQKARIIRKAANAPAQPSAQDRSVASQATAMEMEAYQELAKQQTEKLKQSTDASAQKPIAAAGKRVNANPFTRKYAAGNGTEQNTGILLDSLF